MKKLIFSALALFAFGFANAQDEGGFKAGIHLGMPMGDAADFYTFNFGVDVAYMFPVAENFQLGIASGYSFYSGEEVEYPMFDGEDIVVVSEKFNGAFIPVAASAQYNVAEKIFLGADLGYAIYVGDGEGDGGFYYQPKVGYDMEKIELYLAYKGISTDGTTVSSINIGAAYKF